MNQRIYQIIFQLIITLTLFSLWAAFALLVVNRLFYKDLPGYTIGRICIWEFVAIILAFFLSRIIIKKWGNINIQEIDNELKLTLNPKFGIYFTIYFTMAIMVSIWQFWLFSQNF